MPGKHVRWATHAEYFDGTSSPPTPTFSTLSLPSEDGSYSPLSMGQVSPYPYSPSPDLAAVLHHALSAGHVQFYYDLSSPPTREHFFSNHPSYHIAQFWDQSVTNPPLSSMELQCTFLPWRITICPSKNSRHPFVTFRDFFGCLHYHLWQQVKPAEYDRIKSTRHQAHIDSAFKRRCKRITDYEVYDQEVLGGPRRVDFLGEYVKFAGLSYNPTTSQWTLHVTPPTPPLS